MIASKAARLAASAARAALISTTVVLAGCTASPPESTIVDPVAPTASLSTPPSTSPEPLESGVAADAETELRSQLLYLIEEEKLAHDVYTVLGDTWGGNVFVNIAASETTHQEAVAALLPDYGLTDPRVNEVGLFQDASLQALYDQLIAEGMRSRDDAIDVGVLIEQTDIADLTEALDDAPDDVAVVLERLLAGSQNHLAAFERQA